MKYLYYCNSAYQLLNAINLHWQRKHKNFENIEDYDGDVLILNAFDGVEEIQKILIDNKVFNQVGIADRVKSDGRLDVIKGIVNPNYFLEKSNYNGIKFHKEQYDCLVVAKFSKIPAAIWQLNKNAKLQIYEDGLATYQNNILLNSSSGSYKALYKLFNHDRDFNDYESLYLNKTDVFVGTNNKLKSIPSFNSDDLNKLSDMFKSLNYEINNKKIYWLGQFIGKELTYKMADVLKDYYDEIIYKPHPRFQVDIDGIDVLKQKQIWELSVLQMSDVSDKCFLTIHSTAVFTPKILFDYESYIIFTYRLLDEYDSSIDKSVMNFVNSYRNKEKILIPETLEELRLDVEKYLKSVL